MLSFHTSERSGRWLPAAVAALCWALAAGGAALWWLHAPQGQGLSAASSGQPATTPAPVNTTAVLRALGHSAAASEPASETSQRFQLLGVVAGASGQGAALLAVDGQPAQAFVQGQTVAGGWRVHSLNAEGVRLTAAGLAPMDLSVPAR